MPVYNSGQYLKETVDCLLSQSYTNFEILALNDGSTDDSLSILESFNDIRLIIVNSNINKGLVWQLNKGIEIAKGEYILRMDSDDTCAYDRFKKQVDFMDNHPEVGICGSYVKVFGNENWNWKMPTRDSGIRFELLMGACFAHNSVIIRKSILTYNKLRYRKEAFPVEDYDMWIRIISFTKAANIPEYLTTYRIYGDQVTSNHKIKKELLLKKFAIKAFESAYFPLDKNGHLFDIFRGISKLTFTNRREFINFINRIESFRSNYIQKNELSRLLDNIYIMRSIPTKNKLWVLPFLIRKRTISRLLLIISKIHIKK
jgi:glycosyltransferase involved in cell wall biosynthesis